MAGASNKNASKRFHPSGTLSDDFVHLNQFFTGMIPGILY